MTIYLYVEPAYQNTLWCRRTLGAIAAEAAKKRYPIKKLDPDLLYQTDLDAFFGEEKKRLLLVLSTAVESSAALNEFFLVNGIHAIYINHQNVAASVHCSSIIVDYTAAMRSIVEYLEGTSHERFALYGINRNSSTDMIKKEYFEELIRQAPDRFRAEDIYYNNSDLESCFSTLKPNLGRYNAFICANDIVAYSLITNLRENGVIVPEDCYVVSFGGSLLSQLGSPSLTTVSVDHETLGRQAIFAYSYLRKAADEVYMTAKVSSTLQVRRSTNFATPYIKPMTYTVPLISSGINFYNDEESQRILKVDGVLSKCDILDFQIISGLLRGYPYNRISSGLFVSENVIFYRLKRMLKTADLPSKEDLTALLRAYLSPEEISSYISKELSPYRPEPKKVQPN